MAAKRDTRPYQLVDLYAKLYADKYGRKPTVNKYRDKYGFEDMIDSVGFERTVELLHYYFGTERSSHTLQGLFYNFDKYDEQLKLRDEDRARRAKMMEETKKRVESTS